MSIKNIVYNLLIKYEISLKLSNKLILFLYIHSWNFRMNISLIIFPLFLLLLCISPAKSNQINGNLLVSSCNCTQCCYANNSKIDVLIDYESTNTPPTFLINLTGPPIGIGTPTEDCSIYIESTESCIELNGTDTIINNYEYRYLNCSNTSIGSATLIGNIADQTSFELVFSQDDQTCVLVLKNSLRNVFGCLLIIIILGILGS